MKQTVLNVSETLLALLLWVTIAHGQVRNCFFKRHSTSEFLFVPGNTATPVRCAVFCLTNASCVSFHMEPGKGDCLLSTDECTSSSQDTVCYRRKAFGDKARFHSNEKTDNKKHAEADVRMKSHRLLFIPYKSGSPTIREMNLKTRLVSNYHDQSLIYVISVAFMPLSSRLILCMGYPSKILIAPIAKGEEKIMRNGIARALAVDEMSKLIFAAMKDTSVKYTLYKMDMEGKKYKDQIPHVTNSAEDIVVDVVGKLLYVAYGTYICQMSYNGSQIVKLMKGKYLRALDLDSESGTLYYTDYNNIYKRNLQKKEAKQTASLRIMPQNILFYKGSVFLSGNESDQLCEVKNISSKSNNQCDKLKSIFNSAGLICLVKY